MKTRTAKFIVFLLVVIAACALVAWLPIQAGGKCTGGVYADHPGLRAECLHNLAYPGPGDEPYPAPGTAVPPADNPKPYPTETEEPTPTSPPNHLPIDDLKTPVNW